MRSPNPAYPRVLYSSSGSYSEEEDWRGGESVRNVGVMSTTGTLEASLSEDLQRKKQRWWRNWWGPGGGNLFGNVAVHQLGVGLIYFKLLSYDSSVYWVNW